MKAKNLFLLVLALVVLGGAAWWSQRKPAGPHRSDGPHKLVTFDVNAADRIAIESLGKTAVLARAGNDWTVRNLHDYPADFATIAEHVRRLAGVEGLVVRGGEATLAEFGLAPATTNAPGQDLVTVTFFAGAKPVGRVSLGAPRTSGEDGPQGGYPAGQFVRADGGPVIVAKEFLGGIPRRPQDWIRRSLVAAPRAEVEYVMVHLTNGLQYGLLSDTNGEFHLSGLKAGESMKKETADNVAGALQNLDIVNVLDPKTPAAQTGLDHASLYVSKLKNGLSYTVKLGAPWPADNGRVVQVDVAYEKPEPAAAASTNAPAAAAADTAKQAETEKARLAPWTFVISDYAATHLLSPREELVQVPTNAPAATNAPLPGAPAPAAAAVPAAVPAAP